MDGVVEVSPNALTTLERAKSMLRRDESVEDFFPVWLPVLINSATARLERLTGRRLAARTWRTPVTISCGHTADDATITGAGFTALKALDDAIGGNLPGGSRVFSITSGTALELTKKAKTTGTANITFGSAPMTLSGDGTTTIRVPEAPLLAVYGASSLDDGGVATALDLTGARIVAEGSPGYGVLHLMSGDTFPKGMQNIVLELKAGYAPPSESELGDWESWHDLEQQCLRLIQVSFQDYSKMVGRTGDLNLVMAAQHITSFKLPDDIREGLAPYRRVG